MRVFGLQVGQDTGACAFGPLGRQGSASPTAPHTRQPGSSTAQRYLRFRHGHTSRTHTPQPPARPRHSLPLPDLLAD